MKKRLICFALCSACLCFANSFAQGGVIDLATGTFLSWYGYYSGFDTNIWTVVHTDTKVHLRRMLWTGPFAELVDQLTVFEAPPERKIVSVAQKTDNKEILVILLDNGSVYRLYPSYQVFEGVRILTDGAFRKTAGDALYALDTGGKIYVSRDTAVTWSIDTLGFNASHAQDFAIDSSQFVYAATDKGLFKQHSDSSVWRFVDSLYYDNFGTIQYPYLRSVFVDRKNRILTSPWYSPQGAFISTNSGSTWYHSDAGLSFSGFADDALGNLYGITGLGARTNQLYRSSDSGATWVRIDTAITNRVKPSVPDQFFNSISGDTLLFAATAMGLFVSADQGATWQESNQGLTDENPLGLVKLSSGRSVYSGTLGIFIKNAADTVWTKTYPVNGYQQFQGLSRDGLGNLYALAGPYGSTRLVIRSTDNGTTWQYDTSGITKVEGQTWFVDENGTQHFGTSKFGVNKAMIFAKPLGGSWSLDTAGFRTPATVEESRTFFSDRNGYVYAGGDFSARIWRRPIGGGTWVPDTAGLGAFVAPIYMGAAGKNGTVYAASFTTQYVPSLYRRSAGTWAKVPLPPSRNAHNIDAISVDSSGALFVAFSDFFTYVGRGVFSTTDNGATWQSHGLDSIPVVLTYQNAYGLVSFGDTTYVLTVGRGAYAITRSSGTTFVGNSETAPQSFALQQNYPNPFNPTTTIEFTLPARSHVRLRVFDVLGREVATLLSEERAAGNHRVDWNATNISNGVYFCRMESGSQFLVRKLVLLK